MADQDVNIIGFDGVTPPLWATEETLREMLDQIEKLVDISNKQKNDLRNAIQGGGGKGGGGKTDPKKTADLFDALSSGLKSSSKSAMESAAGFDSLPGPLAGFGKALKKTTGATKLAALGIGVIANQAGKAIATIKESVNTLRDLSDSGVRLEGGFMEVQRGLAQTGMTIAEFGELTGKYAQVMNRQGFTAISNLAQAVDDAEGGFARWGLVTSEGTEIAAELLDQQKRAGIFENINQAKQKQNIIEVMDRLTAYSKVLNVSREAMMESRKAVLDDAQVRFRMSQMSEEDREKARIGLTAMSDATAGLGEDFAWVQQLIKETAVEGINAQSALWQEMAGAGFADVANDIASIGDAAADGHIITLEEIALKIKAHTENKAFMESMFKAGGASREWAMKLGAASLSAEQSEDQIAENKKRGDKKYQTSVDRNVQQLTRLEDSMRQWQATAEYLRTDIFMGLIGGTGADAIEGAIKGIDAMRDAMFSFADSNKSEKMGEWLRENWGSALVIAGAAAIGLSKMLGLAGKGAMAAGRGLLGLGGKLGGVLKHPAFAAFAVGAGIGTAIYKATENTETMIGIGDKIGGITDTILANVFGNEAADRRLDAMNGVMSPDAERQAAQARQRRKENAAKAEAAQATTSASTSSTPTLPSEPTMSAADIAKLDQASQTNYYLAELLKVNKKTGRALTGEM